MWNWLNFDFFFLKDEFLVPHASLFDSNLLVKKDLLKKKKKPNKKIMKIFKHPPHKCVQVACATWWWGHRDCLFLLLTFRHHGFSQNYGEIEMNYLQPEHNLPHPFGHVMLHYSIMPWQTYALHDELRRPSRNFPETCKIESVCMLSGKIKDWIRSSEC